MNLIDVLVQELPKHGGWPEGVNRLQQDGNGTCFKIGGGCYRAYFQFELTNDWKKAVVTREQYEAALSASKKPEWNGEGLPPVGCECERKWKGQPDTHWSKIKVLWVNHEKMLIEYIGEHSKHHVQLINLQSTDFLPIRSEADRNRDESVNAIADICRSSASNGHSAELIYADIAAGKIPGIRIE